MFNIGITEMLIIGAIALLVIGPKGLPDLARSIGKGLTEFRKASNDFKRSLHGEMDHHLGPDVAELAKIAKDVRAQTKNPGDIAEALETAAKVIESGQKELGQIAQPLNPTRPAAKPREEQSKTPPEKPVEVRAEAAPTKNNQSTDS